MSLKNQAINGVQWTTLSAATVTLLQLVQMAILGRILELSAFGIMATVMVFIGFSQAFLDMGVSQAIIHKQVITNEQLSTLYWFNVIAGVFIFLAICIVSPLIASFYNKPELTILIVLVGVTFLIQPFGQQFIALWQKEMRFAEIAKIQIIHKIVSVLVSIGLAYCGFGVYALVFGLIAGIIVQTGQFMFIGFQTHRPSFYFRVREVKDFVSFGAYQMAERTINYFNYQIDTMFIGKILGMEALGVYTIAKQLIMGPNQIINPIISKVTFPMMAKMQNDMEMLRLIYLRTINYISSINFPIYVFLFLFSQNIIAILFGEKWYAAVPVLQILSIFGALRSTGNPVGSLLLARGRADIGFYWNFGLLLIVPISIIAGSQWGLIGVSWALVSLQFLLIVPGWFFLVRTQCGAGFVEYHRQILKPAIIASVSGIFSCITIQFYDIVLAKIIMGSFVGGGLVVGLNWIWNRGFVKDMWLCVVQRKISS